VIVIDQRSPVPPFEQLRQQLLTAVGSGELVPGARLPTVRRFAEDLGIAPGTVARTYRELEQTGVLETRGRHGTFVTANGPEAEARSAAAEFVTRLRRLGVDAATARGLVDSAFDGTA